jgi:hypothetical protein
MLVDTAVRIQTTRVVHAVAWLLLAGASTASADAEAAVYDILPLSSELLAALLLDPSAACPPVGSIGNALAADTAAALLQVSGAAHAVLARMTLGRQHHQ